MIVRKGRDGRQSSAARTPARPLKRAGQRRDASENIRAEQTRSPRLVILRTAMLSEGRRIREFTPQILRFAQSDSLESPKSEQRIATSVPTAGGPSPPALRVEAAPDPVVEAVAEGSLAV